MIIKKAIIIGGAGCIGYQVCKILSKKNIKVIAFDLEEKLQTIKDKDFKNITKIGGSIMDKVSLLDAMKECDVVIHLAAYLGVERTEKNKSKCIEININGTQNVIDCINKLKSVKKILFASSSEVYGEPIENPVSEKSLTQGKTIYAITKLAGEEIVKANYQSNKVKYTILRYFNTYGPYQVSQFVISKFIDAVRNNQPPIINGDGEQIRSYIYSEDTARATAECVLNNKTNNKVLNVGNGDAKITIYKLAKLIIKIFNKNKIKPKFNKKFKRSDRTKKREIFFRVCNSDYIKKLIGFKPKISLASGIKKTIKKNQNFKNW